MDPIVEGRICSCCDCDIDANYHATYIVQECIGPLNKKGKPAYKTHHTACRDCGYYNLICWRENADEDEENGYHGTYEWRAVEYDTKTGQPLRTLHRKRDGTGDEWVEVKV